MDNVMLLAIGSVVGLGVFFAAVLAVANKTLKSEEDPKVADVEGILPGLNCGACGYAGCQAFAIELVKGEALVNGCLAGGQETTDKLAEFLGLEGEEAVKEIAVLHCNANKAERTKSAEYKGIETCKAADIIKGVTNCVYGCLGYGDCAKICPFDAICMAEGLPLVDPDKCTACNKCVEICPRKLFSLEVYNEGIVIVACNSHYPGAKTKNICSKGCIACKVCEKLSSRVFEVENNLAQIDYELARIKIPDWENIIKKCPTKVIIKQ